MKVYTDFSDFSNSMSSKRERSAGDGVSDSGQVRSDELSSCDVTK